MARVPDRESRTHFACPLSTTARASALKVYPSGFGHGSSACATALAEYTRPAKHSPAKVNRLTAIFPNNNRNLASTFAADYSLTVVHATRITANVKSSSMDLGWTNSRTASSTDCLRPSALDSDFRASNASSREAPNSSPVRLRASVMPSV